LYEGWSEWACFAFQYVGFKGVLTLDSRHSFFYSSGRRSGLSIDVCPSAISCLALSEGFLLGDAFAVDGLDEQALHLTDAAELEADFHEPAVTELEAGFDPDGLLLKIAKAAALSLSKCPVDVRAKMEVCVTGVGLTELVQGKANGPRLSKDVEDERRGQIASAVMVSLAKVQEVRRIAGGGEAAEGGAGEGTMSTVNKVILPGEYKYASWIGGSVMAGLQITQDSWLWEKDVVAVKEPTDQRLDCSGDGAEDEDGAGRASVGKEKKREGSHVLPPKYRSFFGRVDGPNSYWRCMCGSLDPLRQLIRQKMDERAEQEAEQDREQGREQDGGDTVPTASIPVGKLVPDMAPRSGSRMVQLPAPDEGLDEITMFTAEEPMLENKPVEQIRQEEAARNQMAEQSRVQLGVYGAAVGLGEAGGGAIKRSAPSPLKDFISEVGQGATLWGPLWLEHWGTYKEAREKAEKELMRRDTAAKAAEAAATAAMAVAVAEAALGQAEKAQADAKEKIERKKRVAESGGKEEEAPAGLSRKNSWGLAKKVLTSNAAQLTDAHLAEAQELMRDPDKEKEDRLALLDKIACSCCVSVDQLVKLLNAMDVISEQVKAVEQLLPRLKDPGTISSKQTAILVNFKQAVS
jgi:hypothetical protein